MQKEATNYVQIIQQTPVAQIGDLELVKEKFVKNYNACHKEKVGELVYHRNVIHLKQIIGASPQLQECDPFSIYAAFVTCAANGYSLDPADNDVYLIARGKKACLDRQAGAYVKRIMRTGQALYIEQAKLVYEGDTFVTSKGYVIEHIENYKSDNIIAGYVKCIVDEKGVERYFIYRKSDWQSWRKKSSNPETKMCKGYQNKPDYIKESLWDNGVIGGENPEPNFLRTKLIKHACKEKCWASGTTPPTVEAFSDIEVDTDDEALPTPPSIPTGTYTPVMVIEPTPELMQHQQAADQNNDDAFAQPAPQDERNADSDDF